MKRTLAILCSSAIVIVGGLIAFTTNASAATYTYIAQLNGANEVPGPGDDTATGTATVTIDNVTNEVCVETTSTISQADTFLYHIHTGAAGVAGPVLVDFMATQDTCVTTTAENVANIIANPAGFYVNLHTEEFQAGAIRGQLQLAPPPSTSSSSSSSSSSTVSTVSPTTVRATTAPAVAAAPRFTG